MTSPASHDPAVRAATSASARRFADGWRRATLNGQFTSARSILCRAQPLTVRQRSSRDAWRGAGLSDFDATMLVLQTGGRL